MAENGKTETPREEIERRAMEFGGAMGGWLKALAKEGFNHQDQLSTVTEELNALAAKVIGIEELIQELMAQANGEKAEELVKLASPYLANAAEPEIKLAPASPLRNTRRPRCNMLALGLPIGYVLKIRGSQEVCTVAGPTLVNFRGKVMRVSHAVAKAQGLGESASGAFRSLKIADGRSIKQLRDDHEAAEAARRKNDG